MNEDEVDAVVFGALMLAAAVVSFLALIVVTAGAATLAGDLFEWWQSNRRNRIVQS